MVLLSLDCTAFTITLDTGNACYQLKSISQLERRLRLFGIIWFVVIVLFYSLVATKYITYSLPAIIPCILWLTVKIGELLTDKETGEFTTSLKRFNYWVTLPLGIYYIIFTFATAFDKTLDSIPLVVGSFIIVCTIYIGGQYISSFRLAIYAIVPLLTLYSAITITVSPILFNQSGLQLELTLRIHQNQYMYMVVTILLSYIIWTQNTYSSFCRYN